MDWDLDICVTAWRYTLDEKGGTQHEHEHGVRRSSMRDDCWKEALIPQVVSITQLPKHRSSDANLTLG